MEKVVLGLDIGIASVGWAIVGAETENIIESGVRLFDSADASKNQERRAFRGIRRNIRRRKHRLHRAEWLLNSINLNRPKYITDMPVYLRLKGLNEKLTRGELYVALYNIIKHRGVYYLEDLEEAKENDNILKNLKQNSEFVYPCQIQMDRYEKYGFFRGTHNIEDEFLMNTFTVSMYESEARKILSTQKRFYPEITDEFIEKFIELLKTKREYYIGPGNEKSRTNYGVYKTSGETKLNLFDELRGKCSIYNGKNGMDSELRASGASYTVQYYNLLNDLCNIKVDGKKLTKEEKIEILNEIRNSSRAVKITAVIKKLYKVDPSTVSGYRIDKDGKEENHSFEVFRAMRKFFDELNIDIEKFSIETLDAVADILTLNTETKGMLDYFHDEKSKEYKHIKDLTDEEVNAFIEFRRKKGNLFNKWSSFSYRLIKQIVPEMLETGDEQHTCITRMGLKKYSSNEGNKMDSEVITSEIYNPVVTKAIRECVSIVNKLYKKYSIKSIVIEMAREKNDEAKRKKEKERQKNYELLNKKSMQYAGLDYEKVDFRKDKNLGLKIKSYYKQQGICPYCGKPISIDEMVNNPFAYEIDHIIPISISFDDSQANKVVVHNGCNRDKSNMTPFVYLKSVKHNNWDYEIYKKYVKDLRENKFINDKQRDLMLFEEDITKEKVVQGFINRNLNDTRYASRVVLNEFQNFFKDKNVKVKVINGSITSQMRKHTLVLEKDRDLDFKHHAVDAMICCYTELSLGKYANEYVNLETGEIINKEKMLELASEEKANYLSESGYSTRRKIERFYDDIKISHKIDTKINRGVSNQTIYSTREVNGETYIVGTVDLYDDKLIDKIKKSPDSFLMSKHDPKTWDQLLSIIKMYEGEKNEKGKLVNPFVKYKENFGPIKKYSKNGNGPVIKNLKYLDKKLGNHIDISHNYKDSKNKVVLLSLKPYRSDIYFDKNQNRFNMVPIKYNDFKFVKGKYVLPIEKYEELLKREGLLKENQHFSELELNGHEFRFSLYKNNVIRYGSEENIEFFRFLSKSHANKNTFEVKFLDKKTTKQTYRRLKKDTTIFEKYNVDILGNMNKVENEKLKLEFSLDNKMI